jgi:hypothetical protein
MSDATKFGSLKRLLRPLRRELSLELAEALLRLKADAEAQERYDELASKNTEGTLTPEERIELESLVHANSILSVLKAEALAFLQQPKAA